MNNITLGGKWKMQTSGYAPMEVTIPGSLYSGLLENKLIDDPYFGENEHLYTKLSENDSEFSRVFCITDEQLTQSEIMLIFHGVDTLAQLYVNERYIGSMENMHRKYSFVVNEYLNIGENTITLKFASPLKFINKAYAKNPIYGVNPDECIPGYQYIRKAHSMFGWDWGPKLPDMGIFRPVELWFVTAGYIDDLYIRQTHTDDEVLLTISTKLKLCSDEYQLKIYVYDGDVAIAERTLVAGEENVGEVSIRSPKLWWPNGLGEQPLYKVVATLVHGGEDIHSLSKNIGLRTLTISRDADKWGEEFCFVVNGVKFFSMGGDYVPEDSILAYTNPLRTRKLLEDCVSANFNTIRVWGGGYYPEDWFYDACDELGLVVWQDFMFACAAYKLTDSFRANVYEEFIHNITRLRNHPSLGLLCGNNEMELEMMQYVNHNERLKQDYIELYERIIAELCEKLAPDIFYWPSSPSSGGGFDNPQDDNKGDVHYWAVWHANKPFEDYRNHYFRFCSEFGFESLPCMKTVESFTQPEDRNMMSAVMESHQKRKGCNSKILNYITQHYLCPTNLATSVYASQLIQADAMRFGVEHWRRFRGRCMGAIYWQLNDCWPVASWSSIDYYGRWKALHYYAKRFYAPVLLSLHIDTETAVANISNETRELFSGSVLLEIKDNDFGVVYSQNLLVNTPQLESSDICTLRLQDYFHNISECRSHFICATLFDKSGNIITQISETIEKPKHYNLRKPNFSIEVQEDDSSFIINISADTYARKVFVELEDIDTVISDNFFDLIGTPTKLSIAKSSTLEQITIEQLQAKIKLTSVYDIGR